MVDLTRSVRFCINDAPDGDGAQDNTFAAYPSMRGLGRFYEWDVRCRGKVNPTTGYFLNIKEVDQAVRAAAIPLVQQACRESPTADPALVLASALEPLNTTLKHTLAAVRWKLTPYYSIEMSPTAPSRVLLRQQFEFAASHRLHCPSMTDDQNRRLFGKCNNITGHGHNYRVEPCVESPVGPSGAAFPLADLERLVARSVIDRFDHKHLNSDTPEFRVESGGVNPSVENIARVCFDLLAPEIKHTCPDATLRSVTVWETDKTWCTYPAASIP